MRTFTLAVFQSKYDDYGIYRVSQKTPFQNCRFAESAFFWDTIYRVSQNKVLTGKNPNQNWVLWGQTFPSKWLGSTWPCLVLEGNDQKQFPDTVGANYCWLCLYVHRVSSSILLVTFLGHPLSSEVFTYIITVQRNNFYNHNTSSVVAHLHPLHIRSPLGWYLLWTVFTKLLLAFASMFIKIVKVQYQKTKGKKFH